LEPSLQALQLLLQVLSLQVLSLQVLLQVLLLAPSLQVLSQLLLQQVLLQVLLQPSQESSEWSLVQELLRQEPSQREYFPEQTRQQRALTYRRRATQNVLWA
jgi:hypothetical protein